MESIQIDDEYTAGNSNTSSNLGKFVGAPKVCKYFVLHFHLFLFQSQPPCFLVFTDVEDSSTMWEKDPRTMMRVMVAYHEILRSQV
jgi:hypothetical protein